MNIVQRMIAASRDVELAGGERKRFVVSEAGHKALADYQDDMWRHPVTGEIERKSDADFTKFVIGVPVEIDPAQAEEFIIQ